MTTCYKVWSAVRHVAHNTGRVVRHHYLAQPITATLSIVCVGGPLVYLALPPAAAQPPVPPHFLLEPPQYADLSIPPAHAFLPSDEPGAMIPAYGFLPPTSDLDMRGVIEQVRPEPVPEPSTGLIVAVGLLALAAIRALGRPAPAPAAKPCPHGHDDWDDCPDCRH